MRKVVRVISRVEREHLIEEIATYYIENNGEMSLQELSETYGRSTSTIYNWVTYQLPKFNLELYHQFRDCMKNQRTSQYSKTVVKLDRDYSCFPRMIKDLQFSVRLGIVANMVLNSRKVSPDWDEINELLFYDVNSHGFNMVYPITSYSQLSVANSTVKFAEENPHKGKWHLETCRTCGKPFVLTLGNYRFFIQNKLYIPKNCKNCIDSRRNT